jgi:hypothetical protein
MKKLCYDREGIAAAAAALVAVRRVTLWLVLAAHHARMGLASG